MTRQGRGVREEQPTGVTCLRAYSPGVAVATPCVAGPGHLRPCLESVHVFVAVPFVLVQSKTWVLVCGISALSRYFFYILLAVSATARSCCGGDRVARFLWLIVRFWYFGAYVLASSSRVVLALLQPPICFELQ